MRIAAATTATIALLLAACGSGEKGLPADPIEKAATCSVVSAANARVALGDATAPLPAEAQGASLRYALLTGAEGESFDADRAQAVVAAAPPLGEKIKPKALETLTPLCAAAYPLPPAPPKLPEDPLVAALGCDELGEFMRRALSAQGEKYIDVTADYVVLHRILDTRIAPLFSARGLSGVEAQRAEAGKAMATIIKTGEPTAVLDVCKARYVTE